MEKTGERLLQDTVAPPESLMPMWGVALSPKLQASVCVLSKSPEQSYEKTLPTYLLRAQSPKPGHWELNLGTRTVSVVSL